jgi:hypothetical protein
VDLTSAPSEENGSPIASPTTDATPALTPEATNPSATSTSSTMSPRSEWRNTPSPGFDDATCVTETEALLSSQAFQGGNLRENPLTFCNIVIEAYSSGLKTTCMAESGQLVGKNVIAT